MRTCRRASPAVNATAKAAPQSRLLQPRKSTEMREAFNRTFTKELDAWTLQHGKPSEYHTCYCITSTAKR